MFFGTYFHQVDSKKRVRVPSKFGKELGSSYILGPSSIRGAIAIYKTEDYHTISQKRHSPFNRELEEAYTVFFGRYMDVTEDAQGRLFLSNDIRSFFDFNDDDKELVFVGSQDHINMMSKSCYEKMNQNMSFDKALEILDKAFEKENG